MPAGMPSPEFMAAKLPVLSELKERFCTHLTRSVPLIQHCNITEVAVAAPVFVVWLMATTALIAPLPPALKAKSFDLVQGMFQLYSCHSDKDPLVAFIL
jgi:hypothetical protein